MRNKIKNIVLMLAITIAGVSLPTSILISMMSKPTTPITEVNNYYYNNTVIERYNDTIITKPDERINYPLMRDDFHFNSSDMEYFMVYIYNASKNNLLWVITNSSHISEMNVYFYFYTLDMYKEGKLIPLRSNGMGWDKLNQQIEVFPFEDTWVIVFRIYDTNPNTDSNITVYHQIKYIN